MKIFISLLAFSFLIGAFFFGVSEEIGDLLNGQPALEQKKVEGPASVTEFLDSYEKVVETVEKMPKGGVSGIDMTRLSQDGMRMSEKASQLQGTASFSASQTKRYFDLAARYMRALQKLN